MLAEMAHTTSVLFRLKVRLLYNQLINWNSAGKVFAGVVGIILMILGVGSAATEIIDGLKMIPGAELILDWLIAAIITYVIFIIFTGDLITGHTLNSGQMSHDFTYLCSLPVSPLSLISVKLFERFISDYLGFLILLSSFIGVVCREGFNAEGTFMAVILYTQISLAVGLAINLVLIVLQRFFKAATINNFFSLLGYLSAFLTFVPYLIISSYPTDAIAWIYQNIDFFNATVFRFMQPAKWLGICFINASFCVEFFYFSAFWLITMLIGCTAFYKAIEHNWWHFSHSSGRGQSRRTAAIFSGWMQKELLLITRDFNLAINAILMPVSIIILEIYFLRSLLTLSSLNALINIIAGSVVYFCMFGPINATGSEGRAIALLETLPMPPSEILRRKFFFWLMIAESIFIPATIAAAYALHHDAHAIFIATATTAVFTAACVWVSISISAIFAVFDSKMLQQRSTFAGKMAGLAIMLTAAPIKGFSMFELKSAVIFLCIGLLLDMKARISIFYRLDKQKQNSDASSRINLLLLLFSVAAAEGAFAAFFMAVIPGMDTGYWALALAITFLTPAAAFFYLGSRSEIQLDTGKPDVIITLTKFVVIMVFSAALASFFPQHASQFKEEINLFINPISAVLEFIGLNNLSSSWFFENACRVMLLSIPVVFFGLLTLMLSRITGSAEPDYRKMPYRLIAITALAMLMPPCLVPTAVVTGAIGNFPACQPKGNCPAAILAALTTATVMSWALFL